MARRAIVEPTTTEYLAAKGILGSKERAYKLVMQNPDAGEEDIIRLAREWKQSLEEMKVERQQLRRVTTEELQENWQDFIFQARPLSLGGFPHRRTDQTRITRLIPMGVNLMGSMSLTAMKPGVPLPNGITDRAVFDALCTMAVTQKSRVIQMDYFHDFIKAVFPDIKDGGTLNEKVTNSIRRLAYCAVMFELGDGKQVFSSVQGLLGAAHLPSFQTEAKMLRGEQPLGFPEFIQTSNGFRIALDESFYQMLLENAMPFPTMYLREFMDDTLGYDLAKFLPARIHAAKSQSKIPIAPLGYSGSGVSLRDQLGSTESNVYRFRAKVEDAVKRIKRIWEGCSAEVTPHHLVINPIPKDQWLVQPLNCPQMDHKMIGTLAGGKEE
jgi:hypothetical protein